MLKYSLAVPFLAVAALAAAPVARAEGSLHLFAGQFFVESELDSESALDVLGARAGWRVAPRWEVEGSLSLMDEGPVDFYSGDLSLRWTPRPDARTRFYLLGGPGVFHVELDDDVLGDADDELTAHVGAGVEIGLGERFLLRPDVRLRWIDGFGGDDVHAEATVGLGFRF